MDSTNAIDAQPTIASAEPAHIPAPVPPTPSGAHSLVSTPSDHCASCGSPVASDQRYCLNCGQRYGEPRLPIMNAVTFMDAMKRPAAPPPAPPEAKRRGISPNAALITGVATLLLAMGVGVLIGRSGNHSATNAAAPAQVITVNGGGGSETDGGGQLRIRATRAEKRQARQEGRSQRQKEGRYGSGRGRSPQAGGDVKLPPATAQPGGKCESGAAGCKDGEFTGEFFGE